MNYSKKLSIIIPVYNTEAYLKRCIDRVVAQTYKNVEIIIINDASTDKCCEIIKEYIKKDNRIIYIEHKERRGFFCSKIEGVKKATGEYTTFLNSDDYVSIDFYRTLMINIQENNSDIAMGKTILEDENGNRKIFNLLDSKHHFTLKGEEIFENFLNQKGISFDWQSTWNKIYKKELWNKALPYYDEIKENNVMTEDIYFSIILLYFAKKLTFTQNDGVFYCQKKTILTADQKSKSQKLKMKIYDVKRTFDFIKSFLVKVNKYEKYEEKYNEWRAVYKDIWKRDLENYYLLDKEVEEIEMSLNELVNENKTIKNNAIYSVQTKWNDGLENIKLAICDEKIKCISFDMFDTLVQRPFIYPSDLFEVLNKYFIEIYGNKIVIDFKKIRVNCEEITRKRLSHYQDITIDEIYETIKETYYFEDEILKKLKEKEKELEIRFCSKRKTGYELYTLALALGKKVIITSDMYLDKKTIIDILEKNGYDNISKIYLSSEIRLSKSQGNLYEYVLNNEGLSTESIIHIGDNYFSDVQLANKYGIKAMYLIKAYNVAMDDAYVSNLLGMFTKNMPSWKDNANSLKFLGIRCMIAVFVNNYFDNPYVTFNLNSDFNSDPYLIGYFALGMYMFGVTKWLLDDTKKEGYDNLIFMSRDGFLPMEAYKIMKSLYSNIPNEEYMYISRKSLISIIIRSKLDFYKLSEIINVIKNTPNEILTYIKDCIEVDKIKLDKICSDNNIDLNKNFDSIENYNFFIKTLIDNFYDQKVIDSNQRKIKKYFLDIFKGKSAVFDIGYSARPELYLSQLCEKPIDTYFLNINDDTAYAHSIRGQFKLKVFFEGKPSLTGISYESVISALAPSCIGYDLKNENVNPIFEKYNKQYQEEFFIGTMQKAAIEFVQDMVDIFKSDIDILFYERYYVSLPIMAYINSSKKIDRMFFDCILFEDDIGIKEKQTLNFLIEKEMGLKNQVELHELINIKNRINESNYIKQKNVYVVDLNNKSKFKKMIFYIHFNKPIFKRRMKEIFAQISIINVFRKLKNKILKK